MLNFTHSLPGAQLVKGRHPFIVDRCRGKQVLHVGCVDAGLVEERFESGELLHKKLDDVAEFLCGIDIDSRGIKTLRSYGYSNLYEFDLTKADPPEALLDKKFDVIVFSEVLEHLSNPGYMLERLKQFMEPGRTQLIVSVPNAFSVTNVLSMAKNVECVHPDHNCYFSFVTLKNTLEKANFFVSEELVYIFDTDILPSKILGKVCVFGENKNSHLQSVGLLHRLYWRGRKIGAIKLLVEMPRVFLSAILLHRSAWWGDGLIAICIL